MSVILSSADGIEDAMAELQKQRRKETSNRMRSAEGNTTDAFKKMDQLRKHQTELIQKRAEAEKNKGFWGSVCDFFSKVANVFASVAKAIQVVASVTPMGLLSLGISVAKVAFKDEIDKTLGGAAPLVTGLGLQCVSASADIQTGGMTSLSSIDGVSATVELGAGKISEGVAGLYGADALDYQADLVDIKAHRKHAMNQLGDEQEAMHEIAASQAKATKLITNILNTNQRVAQNATH
ncbi:MAG: hypothetical protein KAI47_05015 [Deltaproteobacteria bacterium]|nr:hypothetical protein [Deltaproteobacteria bacterium]